MRESLAMLATFIFGGVALIFGLWFAAVAPAMFGLVCLLVAICVGLNDHKNHP